MENLFGLNLIFDYINKKKCSSEFLHCKCIYFYIEILKDLHVLRLRYLKHAIACEKCGRLDILNKLLDLYLGSEICKERDDRIKFDYLLLYDNVETCKYKCVCTCYCALVSDDLHNDVIAYVN